MTSIADDISKCCHQRVSFETLLHSGRLIGRVIQLDDHVTTSSFRYLLRWSIFFSIFQLLSCDKPTGRRLIFYLSRNESDDNVSG